MSYVLFTDIDDLFGQSKLALCCHEADLIKQWQNQPTAVCEAGGRPGAAAVYDATCTLCGPSGLSGSVEHGSPVARQSPTSTKCDSAS